MQALLTCLAHLGEMTEQDKGTYRHTHVFLSGFTLERAAAWLDALPALQSAPRVRYSQRIVLIVLECRVTKLTEYTTCLLQANSSNACL